MVYDVFRAAVPSKRDMKEKPAKKLVRMIPIRVHLPPISNMLHMHGRCGIRAVALLPTSVTV
jgi:hypothetical protein